MSTAAFSSFTLAASFVLVVIIAIRQLRERPVGRNRATIGLIAGGLIGVGVVVSRGQSADRPAVAWWMIAGTIVASVALALLRGSLTKLRAEGPVVLRRGTAGTVGLWLAAFVIHAVGEFVVRDQAPASSALFALGWPFSLALALGAQSVVVELRAARIGVGLAR